MHCRVKQKKKIARGYKTEEIDAREKEKEVQTENFREHDPTKKKFGNFVKHEKCLLVLIFVRIRKKAEKQANVQQQLGSESNDTTENRGSRNRLKDSCQWVV